MHRINDLEEKKMIMGYYTLWGKKAIQNRITNSWIHSRWSHMWKQDFMIDEKFPKIYHQKFVVSATKWKQGIRPQEYEELTDILSSVTNWILSNYDRKIGRKRNKSKFNDMLFQLRNEHLDILSDLAKQKGNYHVEIKISRDELALCSYDLVQDDVVIASGSFDTMLDYLKDMEIQDGK